MNQTKTALLTTLAAGLTYIGLQIVGYNLPDFAAKVMNTEFHTAAQGVVTVLAHLIGARVTGEAA